VTRIDLSAPTNPLGDEIDDMPNIMRSAQMNAGAQGFADGGVVGEDDLSGMDPMDRMKLETEIQNNSDIRRNRLPPIRRTPWKGW